MMYVQSLLSLRSERSRKPISLHKHTHPSFWSFFQVFLCGADPCYVSCYIYYGTLLLCIMCLEFVFKIGIKHFKSTTLVKILELEAKQSQYPYNLHTKVRLIKKIPIV